jgi:hypothetical protein
MTIKKSIAWLVFSVLLSSPSIANANGIDIQTDSSRVRVGQNGSIKIQTEAVNRPAGFASSQGVSKFQYPSRLHFPRSSYLRSYCRNQRYSYNNTQKSSSGTSMTHTSNYASTTVCN